MPSGGILSPNIIKNNNIDNKDLQIQNGNKRKKAIGLVLN